MSIRRVIKVIRRIIPYGIYLKYQSIRQKKHGNEVIIFRRSFFPKQRYVVARAFYPLYGFFSIICRFIFYAEVLSENGFIPILDYEHIKDRRESIIGNNDLLSRIFNIVNSKKISEEKEWIARVDFSKWLYSEKAAKALNCNCYDYNIRLITSDAGTEYYQKANALFGKYFEFNASFIEEVENEIISKFIKGKTVGVILRESFSSSFNKVRPKELVERLYKNEPLVPDIPEIIEVVKRKMSDWEAEKCFVSTMISDSVEKFFEEFSSKLLVMERRRMSFLEYSESIKGIGESKEKLEEYISGANTVSKNKEEELFDYMKEVYAISRCDYLIAVTCSGTVGALMINGGKYKDVFFFEDSNKSKYF